MFIERNPNGRRPPAHPGVLRGTPIVMARGGVGSNSGPFTPVAGQTYTAGADGVITMGLALPESPNYYTRVELLYRYTDADNHWRAYLQFSSAGAWDFRADKVVAGTRTNLRAVTGVGTPDALRVVLSGNDHTFYTGSALNFTQRGTTLTDSAHATATLVGTSYSGATTELLNDSFDSWTGDDPDGWVSYPEDGRGEITEDVNGMRFIAYGMDYWQARPAFFITDGAEYIGVVTIHSITGIIRQRFGFVQQFLDGVGIFAARETANGTQWVIGQSGGAANAVISNATLYAVGNLSDGNGPKRLYYKE